MVHFVYCSCIIAVSIIAHFNSEISADTRVLSIAILMCGYIIACEKSRCDK